VAGRVGDQPTYQLLPEKVVGLVVDGRTHLPPPSALGGEHGNAPAAVVLRDQQRHFLATGVHFRQYRRARLGRPGILVVSSCREASSSAQRFFAGSSTRRQIMLSAPAGVSSAVAGSRWKVSFLLGSVTGSRSAMLEEPQASIGQRETAGQ